MRDVMLFAADGRALSADLMPAVSARSEVVSGPGGSMLLVRVRGSEESALAACPGVMLLGTFAEVFSDSEKRALYDACYERGDGPEKFASFGLRWGSVEEARTECRAQLRAACAQAITSGFCCAALGAPHSYPSQETDQLNLTATVVAAALPGAPVDWVTPFWCCDEWGEWARRPHTAAQIIAVGLSAKAHVSAAQERYELRLRALADAVDQEAIEAVQW